MSIKNLCRNNPKAFMQSIHDRIPNRRFWKDEELTQVFWLGVYKSIKTVDWEKDPIKYLTNGGNQEIKNYILVNYRKSLVKYCNSCGRYVSFRKFFCPRCNTELIIINRFVEFVDSVHEDDAIIDKVMIEQFVGILENTEFYVAKRWLLERADLYEQNHLKTIAIELNISAPRVAQIKNKIRKKFKEWYK
jgi:hypothetical protein